MEVEQHPRFQQELDEIKDAKTKLKILASISRLKAGNPGDSKAVGDGVVELKIDYGPGWRIYYIRVGTKILMLLSVKSKSRQQQDIEAAKKLAREVS
jgi:putative addiction module killer protein